MRLERIIPRRGINDDNRGKKHALHTLLTASTADIVWLQDDDILPPTASDAEALDALGDHDLLILPLRMVSPNSKPSLLEQLQMAEYAGIQSLTLLTARRGHPVLCSSANLLVRRTRWLESYPDLHPEIPSGDDMFLLESFKRRGLRIACADAPHLTATIRPLTSWRAFLRQRMRWAGKAPAYHDRDILFSGTIVLIINILQFLCPPLLLLFFPFEYALIRRRKPATPLPIALLLALLYPYYMLLSLLGGIWRTFLTRHPSW